jgi:DNA-binding MarR family transcriptional regulator
MTQISHDEYASAATLRAALRRFGNESARVLREHGLTTERYELLLAIKARSENRSQATIAHLAEDLHLAPSSMTQLARRAEDAGLLYRGVSREDARVHYLLLTDTGASKLSAAASDLGPERHRLITLLRKLDTPKTDTPAATTSSRLAQV